MRKFTIIQPLIRHGSLSGSKARAAVYIALAVNKRMNVEKKVLGYGLGKKALPTGGIHTAVK